MIRSGIGKERAALLVVIGVKKDGSKGYLALEPGYRESKESWGEVLRQFKSQVNATCLIWKTMMIAEMSFRKLDVSSW